jgi:hypothetical protein
MRQASVVAVYAVALWPALHRLALVTVLAARVSFSFGEKKVSSGFGLKWLVRSLRLVEGLVISHAVMPAAWIGQMKGY